MALARDKGAYSRFVGIAKIVLPIIALALLSTVFLVQEDGGFEGGLIFSKADRASLQEGLTIRDPRFLGVTRSGDAITVTAVTAVPDSVTPKEVVLQGVYSRTNYINGETAELRSQQGLADVEAQTLALSGGMEITLSNGYIIVAPDAFADMTTGTIVSDGPVHADGPGGELDAGTLHYQTVYGPDGKSVETRRMTFENGVKMIIYPTQRETAPKGDSE